MATDVTIIGAGLSGLIAAQQIQVAGKSVTVLDKGRSVGGRLATRRIADGIADHGAQFFTVRTEEFQKLVDDWLERDLVYVWGHGWSDGSIKRTKGDGHPRYATRGGMNSLAKDLAKPVRHIHTDTRVSHVNFTGDVWRSHEAEGFVIESQVMILTAPVPQSLALIEHVKLNEDDKAQLERISYGPCLCGLFVIDGEVDLPQPGARQNFDDQVYWIADNKAKGISPDERVVTMHAEARYSRTNYDEDPETVLSFFRETLAEHLVDGATIKEEQLKKWRYSVPITTHPHDILQAEGLPLIFAGDAFGGRGRIEGAFLSGMAAGKAAVALLDA